jgi:hypothetical protein
VAGVIASGIVNQGIVYVAIQSGILYFSLALIFYLSKPLFEWAEAIAGNDDTQDRPYQNLEYAS